MHVAPFDGTVVDIVASLHLADGNVVSLGIVLKNYKFLYRPAAQSILV